jgi:hypothetical protein
MSAHRHLDLFHTCLRKKHPEPAPHRRVRANGRDGLDECTDQPIEGRMRRFAERAGHVDLLSGDDAARPGERRHLACDPIPGGADQHEALVDEVERCRLEAGRRRVRAHECDIREPAVRHQLRRDVEERRGRIKSHHLARRPDAFRQQIEDPDRAAPDVDRTPACGRPDPVEE